MSDYKLVPVEPTSDMLCSGIDAYGIEDCLDADVHAIYTSMIAAAPAVQGEPVVEAGALRGSSGFTTAVFESSKVPEGTKLYASPQPAEKQPGQDVAELVHALSCAMAFIKSHVADHDITPEMQAAYRVLEDANPNEILARYSETQPTGQLAINTDRLMEIGTSAAFAAQTLARAGKKLRKRGGDLT